MEYSWDNGSYEIKPFLHEVIGKVAVLLDGKMVGVYLHGSLAMGGFNPRKSDIDLIVVTEQLLPIQTKRALAHFFLQHSNRPFPIEISSLSVSQLESWKHPMSYDFHFSEFWRELFEVELKKLDYVVFKRRRKDRRRFGCTFHYSKLPRHLLNR